MRKSRPCWYSRYGRPIPPVWFNIGHWEQWHWGRPDLRESYTGHGNKAYHTKGTKNNLKTFTVQSTYEYPQCSACFLTEVGDSMEDILDHLTTEGRIFASGSGVGISLPTLRSSKEPISGKGRVLRPHLLRPRLGTAWPAPSNPEARRAAPHAWS